MENPEIRVHWSVALWGPLAGDSPEHSVSGIGSTPEEAYKNLQKNIEIKKDLVHAFSAQARSLD